MIQKAIALLGSAVVLAGTCQLASATTISANSQTVGFVYQLSDPESFDFEVPGLTSDCGSNFYRVRTADLAVLNRKFTLILSAFLSDRKISFSYEDVGSCESNRKLIGWVRITN